MYILEKYKVELKGLETALIGHGPLVGQPMEIVLKARKAKVTVITEKTKNIKEIVKKV